MNCKDGKQASATGCIAVDLDEASDGRYIPCDSEHCFWMLRVAIAWLVVPVALFVCCGVRVIRGVHLLSLVACVFLA
jgi:hypothetical protein